jgi:hypothetical protein
VSEREYKRAQKYMLDLFDLYGQIRSGDRDGRVRELVKALSLPCGDYPEKALSFVIGAEMKGQILFSLEKLNQEF